MYLYTDKMSAMVISQSLFLPRNSLIPKPINPAPPRINTFFFIKNKFCYLTKIYKSPLPNTFTVCFCFKMFVTCFFALYSIYCTWLSGASSILCTPPVYFAYFSQRMLSQRCILRDPSIALLFFLWLWATFVTSFLLANNIVL